MTKPNSDEKQKPESSENLSGDDGFFARRARPHPRGQSYGGTGGIVKGLPEDSALKLRREALRKGL